MVVKKAYQPTPPTKYS